MSAEQAMVPVHHEKMWVGVEDFPWFVTTARSFAEEPLPNTGRSDSGITYTIDRDPEGERWCAENHYLYNAFCCMPQGHDTPHLAVSAELVREIGPIVVTSIQRVSKAWTRAEVGEDAYCDLLDTIDPGDDQ